MSLMENLRVHKTYLVVFNLMVSLLEAYSLCRSEELIVGSASMPILNRACSELTQRFHLGRLKNSVRPFTVVAY